jgi:hypothetical protein
LTAIAFRLTGSVPKARHWVLFGVVVAATVALSALARGPHGVVLLALGGVTAGGLLLDVQLPRGGRIPLGHAVVIALAEILPPADIAVVMAVALGSVWIVRRRKEGNLVAGSAVALFGASALAAVTVRAAFASSPSAVFAGSSAESKVVLARVVVAGVAYLAVDLFGRGKLMAPRAERISAFEVLPVYVTLLCAAALLAIAYIGNGPVTAMVAAIPLLITRFSFERYSAARVTYSQTIQALSMVPEVAGLTALGHGERTAVYAGALADALRLGADRSNRVATAARLHHIGHISLHEPEERHGPVDLALLAKEGAEILRETGFLADVADLVAEVQNPPTSQLSLEAAIVRVASALDDEVGDQPWRTRRALVEVLAQHPDGAERTVAITLLQLCESHPDLAEQARLAGEPITRAAGSHPDRGGHEHEDHSHCV